MQINQIFDKLKTAPNDLDNVGSKVNKIDIDHLKRISNVVDKGVIKSRV